MKPSELSDRLRFAMWLAQLTVGCDSTSASFAEAIGKHENQVSKWLRGVSAMAEDSAEQIGRVVGVDDVWLRRPEHPKAEEPELFAAWWEKQSEWQAARAPAAAAADKPPRRGALPAPAPIPAPRGGSAQRQERKRGA